ncbi:MAG: hypothetical protein Q9182_004244 [Xanthomendoza sp. 2 TL-2023]
MSGVEALAVFGIIANVARIVDFSSKVLGRIKEASDDVYDVPKAFRDVQSTLPLLASILNQLKAQIDSGALDEDACHVLKPVLDTCLSRASELKDILDKCNPQNGLSNFRRGWKAIKSLRQDKKVEEISEAIHKCISMFTCHRQIAAPAINAVDLASTGAGALAEDFTGREEQMSALASKFSQSEEHVRVAVVGLGGIGKTRLVRQYIEQYKDSNTSVFWIHAGTAERMRSGSRDIAEEVGVQGSDDSSTDILVKLKQWLESQRSGRWLLIYDNVDDIDLMYDEHGSGLATHFPRSNHGSIILTTRNRQIGVKFAKKNLITLSDLTQAQSIGLMATRLGDETTESRPALSKLAEALGGIPLALVQATSFMEENHLIPERYLKLYETNGSNKIDLLNQDFEDDTRDPELKNPIATTWIVTFEHLKNHRPLAADILCLLSMFDAQAVPESLIWKTAKHDTTSISPGAHPGSSSVIVFDINKPLFIKDDDDLSVPRIVSDLATTMINQGKHNEAEPLLLQVVEKCTQEHGEESELTIGLKRNLLRNTIAQDRIDESNAMIDRIAPFHHKGFDNLILAGFYKDTDTMKQRRYA